VLEPDIVMIRLSVRVEELGIVLEPKRGQFGPQMCG
jgi:hypothetical protein